MMKNMLSKNLILLLFVALFSIITNADVPPPSDQKRMMNDLSVTLRDDFADYRFFIAYGGGLQEIMPKKDVPLVLEGNSHGGQQTYSFIVAIPKADLPDSKNLSEEVQQKFVVKVIGRKNAGYVQLVQHTFHEDVPKTESADKKVVEIEVKRIDNLPKAFDSKGGIVKQSDQKLEINNASTAGIATIIGGVLLTLAVLLSGLFFFRRSRKK
jgi:hypothetical protein